MIENKQWAELLTSITLKISSIIFICEMIIMLFFHFIPLEVHGITLALIDSALLSLLSTPFIYFFVIKKFISKRQQAEKKLYQLAREDILTKLPNRAVLMEDMDECINDSKKSGEFGAALFFDVNKFKFINDTYGHEVGDLVLCHIAKNIKEVLRTKDVCARIGGDEFVVILSDLGKEIENAKVIAEQIAHRYLNAVGREFVYGELNHRVQLSIGISLFPFHSDETNKLIKYADEAMYVAKNKKDICISIYSDLNNQISEQE